MRVLIVEDEFILALNMEDLLNGLGCEVVGPVARLDEAVDLARRETLDAAILDVNLGGVMVTPVAEALAQRGIPFLFTTGYDMPELPGGFKGVPHLRKPFDDRRLEEEVRRLLDRQAG